jgi:hypothetical protein
MESMWTDKLEQYPSNCREKNSGGEISGFLDGEFMLSAETVFWNVAPCILAEIGLSSRGGHYFQCESTLIIVVLSTSETSVNL